MGVGHQRHAPATLPPGKIPGVQCRGGRVDPRAGLDVCRKCSRDGNCIPDHPAYRESHAYYAIPFHTSTQTEGVSVPVLY